MKWKTNGEELLSWAFSVWDLDESGIGKRPPLFPCFVARIKVGCASLLG